MLNLRVKIKKEKKVKIKPRKQKIMNEKDRAERLVSATRRGTKCDKC